MLSYEQPHFAEVCWLIFMTDAMINLPEMEENDLHFFFL